MRQHPVTPRRITYTVADRKVVIERMALEGTAFLERMHRRRGFQQPFWLEDTWAFSVDLAIAAIVFWALSGLRMWWELKVTRKLGAVCLIGGAALMQPPVEVRKRHIATNELDEKKGAPLWTLRLGEAI